MGFTLFRELLEKAISETAGFRRWTTLTFSGMGEPLVDPTLDSKITLARARGLSVLVLTNGILLSVERFKALENLGVGSVRVSLHAHSADAYARLHGTSGSEFAHLRESLTEVCAVKRDSSVIMTYDIVPGVNERDVQPWIDYWKGKADLLEVWTPHNWASAMRYRAIAGERLPSCGRPWYTPIQIQVDGTVNLCCFDYDGALTLGDLKTQSLTQIFNSEPYLSLERRHRAGDFTNSDLICRDCDQRKRDQSGILIYSSRGDVQERVKQVSTTYVKVSGGPPAK